jgi:membrane protein YqaA with SNARE-associated domain
VENIQVIKGLYDYTMKLAEHRNGLAVLALVSFIESSVFPIPPDILIIPMVLAAREKAWTIALICTVASVLGGIAGYGIGFFLYESIGGALLEFYGYANKFSQFQSYYNEWGAWIVGGAGLTPFPYKVITIASGVADLNLLVCIVVVARLALLLGRWLTMVFWRTHQNLYRKKPGSSDHCFFRSFVLWICPDQVPTLV